MPTPTLYELLLPSFLPKAPAYNPDRDAILSWPQARSDLDKLVDLGANREKVLSALEVITLGCKREAMSKKAKKVRAFHTRPEFHDWLGKAAKKIEKVNKDRGLGLTIRVGPPDLEYELYLRLPGLLRSYADYLARSTRRFGRPRATNPVTRPKVFLAEHVRKATGNPHYEVLASLVAAAYHAAGVEPEFEAKAIEQAWKRHPHLRESLFPPPPPLIASYHDYVP